MKSRDVWQAGLRPIKRLRKFAFNHVVLTTVAVLAVLAVAIFLAKSTIAEGLKVSGFGLNSQPDCWRKANARKIMGLV